MIADGISLYSEIIWKIRFLAGPIGFLAGDVNCFLDFYPAKENTGFGRYQLVSHAEPEPHRIRQNRY
jgi:hypothetical protein